MNKEIKKHIDNMPYWFKELRDHKPCLESELRRIGKSERLD